MCGRFTLTRSAAEVAAHFALEETPALAARWNVAPGQPIAVVAARAGTAGTGARELAWRVWGLRPPWAGRGPQPVRPLVNARAESAARRPTFREALAARRGLVPADGFYEWRGRRGSRAPHHVARPDGGLLGLAALFEEGGSRGGDPAVHGSVVLLTREAHGPVRALHDRMPLIVAPAAYAAWLDPARDGAAALAAALESDAELRVRPVSTRVNDVAHDDPGCLDPPEAPELPLG